MIDGKYPTLARLIINENKISEVPHSTCYHKQFYVMCKYPWIGVYSVLYSW